MIIGLIIGFIGGGIASFLITIMKVAEGMDAREED